MFTLTLYNPSIFRFKSVGSFGVRARVLVVQPCWCMACLVKECTSAFGASAVHVWAFQCCADCDNYKYLNQCSVAGLRKAPVAVFSHSRPFTNMCCHSSEQIHNTRNASLSFFNFTLDVQANFSQWHALRLHIYPEDCLYGNSKQCAQIIKPGNTFWNIMTSSAWSAN